MAIANLQLGPKVTSGATGTVTGTLPNPSTPRTLLVAVIGTNSAGFTFAGPTNWVQANKSSFANDCAVWYLSGDLNPGGLSSFIFTDTSGGNMTVEVSEWSGVGILVELVVGSGSTSGASINSTVSVTLPAIDTDSLGIVVQVKSLTGITFTPGVNWTQMLQENAFSGGAASVCADYQVGLTPGNATDTDTATGASANWDGLIVFFTPAKVSPHVKKLRPLWELLPL